MRYPTKKKLIEITVQRAEKVARKVGTTVGGLMRELVHDKDILRDLVAAPSQRRRRKSITLDMYQRIHDGLEAKEASLRSGASR